MANWPLPLDAFDIDPQESRERLARARRSGKTGWLWPAVSIESWREALDEIARITQAILTNGHATQTLDGDAEAVSVAGYTSGMGPLLGRWLQDGKFSASMAVRQRLGLVLRHNRLRMQTLSARAADIARRLLEYGVFPVFLKGIHTCAYFPEAGTRPLADLDLLIAPQSHSQAARALADMGFVAGPWSSFPSQQNWRDPASSSEPRSLSFVHADDPWSIDLQLSLNRRYCPGAPIVRLDAGHGEGSVEPWATFAGAGCLTPTLLVLHLACHASCGLANLTMVRLVELVFVTRQTGAAGQFCWSDFLTVADTCCAAGHAYPALHLCNMLAPATVPREVLAYCRNEAPRAVRRVIERLTPSRAQTVMRWSLREKFMWTSPRGLPVQLLYELLPGRPSPTALARIYRNRMSRVLTGRYSL